MTDNSYDWAWLWMKPHNDRWDPGVRLIMGQGWIWARQEQVNLRMGFPRCG